MDGRPPPLCSVQVAGPGSVVASPVSAWPDEGRGAPVLGDGRREGVFNKTGGPRPPTTFHAAKEPFFEQRARLAPYAGGRAGHDQYYSLKV